MKSHSFTKINLIMLSCCPIMPHLYPYVICQTWGILTSFHVPFLMNPDAMKKLNEKINNKLIIGNLITHIIPAGITLIYKPKKITIKNGIIASVIHLSWGLYISDGSLSLSNIYAPLNLKEWHILWTVAILTEITTPFIYNKYLSKLRKNKALKN